MTLKYLKPLVLTLACLAIGCSIWFITPFFTLNDLGSLDPWGQVAERLGLTAVVFLSIGIIGIIQRLMIKFKSAPVTNLTQATPQQTFEQQLNDYYRYLKSKFSPWQRRRRHYLQLPWYLALGQTASGQSCALFNSGLEAINPAELKLEVLPHHPLSTGYQWHLSREAVIIDISLSHQLTATPQPISLASQDPILAGILKFLKRLRMQKPLQGIIISLSLPSLLTTPETEQATYQQLINMSLRHIAANLKTTLPVYIMLTQADQIAGFCEFFEDFTPDERNQILGIHLPITSQPSELVAHFEQAYQNFLSMLASRVLHRLATEPDATKRQLISYLPQQLQLFADPLKKWLYVAPHLVIRGMYFSSSQQCGISHDFLLAAASQRFQLSQPSSKTLVPQHKAYFLKSIFHSLILPDTQQLQQLQLNKFKQCYQQLMLSGLSLGLFICLVGLSHSYAMNKANLADIAVQLPAYQQAVHNLAPGQLQLTAMLPLLKAAAAIYTVYAHGEHQLLQNFAIYQPYRIQSQINSAWQQLLSHLFLPSVKLQLAKQLQQFQHQPELLYQTLKAYLVFSGDSRADKQWLTAAVTHTLMPQFPSDDQQVLQFALADSLALPTLKQRLNQPLIQQSQASLQRITPAELAYYELKQTALAHPNINLPLTLQQSAVFTFPIDSIPQLFSLAGYYRLRGTKSHQVIQQLANNQWVLDIGHERKQLIEQMTPALWSHYNNDYHQAWQKWLQGIHIAPFTSYPQALQSLELLTASKSPMLDLLNFINQNTAFIKGNAMTVSSQFAQLNQLTASAAKNPSDYQTLRQQLLAVHDYLNAIYQANNRQQAAFEAAKAYLQGKTSPLQQLASIAAPMPEPVRSWLNSIVTQSVGLLLTDAYQYINTAWQTRIIPSYQANIAGQFPFNLQSDTAISLENFGDFFGNDGVLAQFIQNYLSAFIDTTRHPWRLLQVGGHSLGLSHASLQQLERSQLINTLFFTNGSKIPELQFMIKPRFLDPAASSINLQLGNQSISYRHGPQALANWHWPMGSDNQQVSITMNDFANQNYSRSFEGPWGWFRLLSQFQLQATATPGHFIWNLQLNHYSASFELWSATNQAIFELTNLAKFSLPNRL